MKTKGLFYRITLYLFSSCIVISLCMLCFSDAVALSNVINIESTPISQSTLTFMDYIDITFNYFTSEPNGVCIFIRPFTNGSLTPNYIASGSPIYPCTSLWGISTLYMGNGNAKFTIRHGEVTVDQLRIRITSADRSRLLHEFFIPVEYHYTSEPTEDFSVGISNWSDSLLTYYIFLDGKAVISDTIQPRDGCFCEGDLCICKKPDYKFKGYDLRLEHGTHTIKAIVFSYYFGIFIPVGIINDTLFNVPEKIRARFRYNESGSFGLIIYDFDAPAEL